MVRYGLDKKMFRTLRSRNIPIPSDSEGEEELPPSSFNAFMKLKLASLSHLTDVYNLRGEMPAEVVEGRAPVRKRHYATILAEHNVYCPNSDGDALSVEPIFDQEPQGQVQTPRTKILEK